MNKSKSVRLLSCLLALLMVVSAIPVSYAAGDASHLVQFLNEDGRTKLDTQMYYEGETPKAPATNPKREPNNEFHYDFIGWKSGEDVTKLYTSTNIPKVTGPVTYIAQYTPVSHTVKLEKNPEVAECMAKDSGIFTCSECGYSYKDVRNHKWKASEGIKISFDSAKSLYTIKGEEKSVCEWCNSTSSEVKDFSDRANDAVKAAKVYINNTNLYNKESQVFKKLYDAYTAFTAMSGLTKKSEEIDEKITAIENATISFKNALLTNADETYVIYTVKFYLDDGTLYDEKTYHFADKVIVPENPVKNPDGKFMYEFKGWDSIPEEYVSGNREYKAVFESSFIDYEIKFLAEDGKEVLLDTAKYHYEADIVFPETPKKEATDTVHFVFAGWNDGTNTYSAEKIAKARTNATYTATFTEEAHKWVSQKVAVVKGEDGKYTVAGKEEFVCEICKKEKEEAVDLTKAYNDAVSASKEIAESTHYADSELLNAVKTAYAALLVFEKTPASSEELKKAVDTADKAVADFKKAAEEDEKLYKEYTVKFVGEDGTTVISEATKYIYNKAVAVPENQTKEATDSEHYIFAGWTDGEKTYKPEEIPAACADVTYKAVFTAEAHNGGEATCANKAVCAVCAKEYGELKEHTPADKVKENEKVSTCIEKGKYDEVSYCSVCKAELSRQTVETDFADHIKVKVPAVEATCCATGLTEGEKCEYCDKVFAEQEVVEKNPDNHTPEVTIKAIAPTCEKQGNTEEICCKDCKVILTASTTVEALGHKYEEVLLQKASLKSDGSTGEVCSVCNDVKLTNGIAKIKTVSLSKSTIEYDGKAHKPTVTVKDSDGKALKKGTDFTVTYPSGRKKVGSYTVVVDFTGKYEGTKSLKFAIKPGKVGTVKATATVNSVKLTWKAVPGATGYRVYKYNTSKKTSTKIADTTKLTYTVKKLSSSTKYVYIVKAYTKKSSGTVYWGTSSSDKVTAVTLPATPSVKLTSGKNKLTVSYGKVSGAKGYQIYVKAGSNGTYKKVKSTSKTSYTYSGLKSGTKYYVKVRAYNKLSGTVFSSFSAAKTVTVK